MPKAVSLLLALLLLGGCAGGQDPLDARSDDGYYGAVLEEQYVVPDITLTDDTGAPYNLATDTTAPLTLVFFGYTNCPDICQAVMAALASAMTRLDDAQRAEVDVVFVTTDPARDDEATLTTYLDRFDPGFVGLTGRLADIEALGKDLGVFIAKGVKLPSGGYEVDHSTQVIAVDAAHRSPIVWTYGTSSAQFASDIIRLLDNPLEDS
ncbi:Electron transport protein SCO1/SenC [metagenome]|uniref:Electron transport protein SCO1/SenC n=1 Tax=metagenome TaxID=256318 RepID=A0A2P2BWF3_9ZZZZ